MMNKPIILSLFDKTGIMLEPWNEAGYKCWAVDQQHPIGSYKLPNGINTYGFDLSRPFVPPCDMGQVFMVFAFVPCDNLAVSGARWFKVKGLKALYQSLGLLVNTLDIINPDIWPFPRYMIENPVSTISTYWRKPDHIFHPHEYTAFCSDDNYTKKTCLWTGNRFVMPKPKKDPTLGPPDNRIHTCPPGIGRKDFRSATPKGFAQAVYEVNTTLP